MRGLYPRDILLTTKQVINQAFVAWVRPLGKSTRRAISKHAKLPDVQLYLPLSDPRFFQFQSLIICVERRLHAKRERELIGGVPDGETCEGWDVRRAENVVEDFAER